MHKYHKFFIYEIEKEFCKLKKIDVLISISCRENSQIILQELNSYINNGSIEVAKAAVFAIGEVCAKVGQINNNILLQLLKRKGGKSELASQAVISLSKFLESQSSPETIKNQIPLVALLTTFLLELKDEKAKKQLFYQVLRFVVLFVLKKRSISLACP